MKRAILAIAALMTFGVVAHAQETPGVTAPEGTKGVVRKNRAPVSNEVLKVRFKKPKEFKLDNGLRVFIFEDHRVPGITISLMMRSGSLFWPVPEVAEAAGSLMQEGTTTRTSKDIAREVDGMGAELHSGAGSEYMSVGGSALSDFAEPLLDLVVDVALHPAYPQDRLDEWKYRRIASLTSRKTNPDTLSTSLVSRVNYGESKIARLPPKKENIEAVTRASLFKYHMEACQPNIGTLTVVGDVEPKAILARVSELLSDWKPSGKPLKDFEKDFKPKDATAVHIIDRPGSKQTMLRFTNIAIKRDDPDYIPLVVANRILGGGSTSRLFQHIREDKGYTYGAYSDFSAPKWTGTWGAHASVRTEVTGPAVQAFLDDFRLLQNEPVGAEELARVKKTIIGSFARTLESPDGILGKFMDIVRNNLPADYWETYPARVQAVTPEDVQRVARKYLGDNRIQIIAVGERASIEPVLRQFGPVYVYDTDIEPISGPAGVTK